MMSNFAPPLLLAAAFALQPPGPFHGNEPVARDGERWLALRIDPDAAALVATTLRVRAVEDPITDATGQRTGLAVTPDDAGTVAFLRGGGLRAGAVQRASFTAANSTATNWPEHAIAFAGRAYRLHAQCDDDAHARVDTQAQYRCRIVLDDGARHQVLVAMGGYRDPGAGVTALGDDATPVLLFAGDLDRDGRLDLVFDVTDHYNVSRPTLFLSSLAGDDALVGEAARYEAVGC